MEAAWAGGYQGGTSDIGYPPFVAPQAEFHTDKGGWIGRYDPNYTIPVYGRGTEEVQYLKRGIRGVGGDGGGGDAGWSEPGPLAGNIDWGDYPESHMGAWNFINNPGGPGMFGSPGGWATTQNPWGPGQTMIPTYWNAAGYPLAVPAGGWTPDKILNISTARHSSRPVTP
jgi:hypothetical protein